MFCDSVLNRLLTYQLVNFNTVTNEEDRAFVLSKPICVLTIFKKQDECEIYNTNLPSPRAL